MEQRTDPISNLCGNSEIRKFYAGKTIFLTGSTGFMGQCLVEKFLRGCPDIRRIYVLVRKKRGSSTDDRMKKYFDDPLFETVRKMCPDYESKIHAIEGDLKIDGMSLSEENRKTLIEEVNLIIHNASNVKFNERISTALRINVIGTMGMIELAKSCKFLEAFMYVSTAYSHCYRKNIEEEVYPTSMNEKLVREMIAIDENTKGGMREKVLDGILDKFPNTYCFTKAAAENFVNEMGKEVSFPCTIYRPSIVLSSWKEPVKSWCGNLNGPATLFIGYALGLVHAAYCHDAHIDFIPVDMSINSIIVAMWDSVKNRAPIDGSFVYNYGSSNTKPMTLRKFRQLCMENDCLELKPSIHTIWPHSVILTECVYYFAILHVLFHFIPAVFIDAYFLVNGKKPQALSAYKKGTFAYSKVLYFANGDWRIHIPEMNKAIDRMTPSDREAFFCDLREIDWADYTSTYWEGLRLFILKDPPSTIPEALKKTKKLIIAQRIIICTILIVILYTFAWLLGIF